MYVFILSSDNWVAAYWEMAARSACGVFSGCRCLVVGLVFPTSVFGVGISF